MTAQAAPGVWVTLRYRATDAEGELVADETVERLFGYGQLLPAVEQAVDGLRVGGSRNVRLGPEQAFGKRDPSAVLEVERSEFPSDVAPGDRFEAEDADGAPVVLTVLDVDDERIVLDQNHPLAGQRIELMVELLAARVASEAELGAAAAALSRGFSEETGLISPARLLRGGTRRYVRGPAGSDATTAGRAEGEDTEMMDDPN